MAAYDYNLIVFKEGTHSTDIIVPFSLKYFIKLHNKQILYYKKCNTMDKCWKFYILSRIFTLSENFQINNQNFRKNTKVCEMLK